MSTQDTVPTTPTTVKVENDRGVMLLMLTIVIMSIAALFAMGA
jgi:hypothetical protein